MGVKRGIAIRAENHEILKLENPFQNTEGTFTRLYPSERLRDNTFKTMTQSVFVYSKASLWAGILSDSSDKLEMNGVSRSRTLHRLLEIPCSAFALAGY